MRFTLNLEEKSKKWAITHASSRTTAWQARWMDVDQLSNTKRLRVGRSWVTGTSVFRMENAVHGDNEGIRV